uniref:Elongation of very long chain fatty acids protein n=1 Tax=Brachionus plicatilis TaxID=10195 RepID=A0A482G1Q0_BRAPC|nr:elongation of very long chain fatty acid 3/6b [Brachionus plicatilis]
MSFEPNGPLYEPLITNGYYQSKSGINYTNLFFYEKKFFSQKYVDSKRVWMQNNWHTSFIYAFVYIVAIFAGQAFMRTRDRYDLRKALIAWNFVLALFSIMGTIRVWPEFFYTISNKGIVHSVCSTDYTYGVTGCWSWLFILSKVPELVDTVFIILRKQQLIFLHWYHHATVLIYCWYSSKDFTGSGRWFVLMNYTVHAVMYSYYGFRALRFNIPKWVNIAITSGQISQMIFGIYINLVAYSQLKQNRACDVSYENIFWSFAMYFSYFVLFFHFFYKAYIAPKPKSKSKVHANGNGNVKLVNGKSHGIESEKDK